MLRLVTSRRVQNITRERKTVQKKDPVVSLSYQTIFFLVTKHFIKKDELLCCDNMNIVTYFYRNFKIYFTLIVKMYFI